MKKFSLFLFAVLMATTNIFAFTQNGLHYTITPLNAKIDGIEDNRGTYSSVTIPNIVTYNGEEYRVISIEDKVFDGCSNLSSVTFDKESNLKTIGESAFNDCYHLSEINIPKSVTSIGNGAFSECIGLSSVTFEQESKLSTIGSFAFCQCQSLSNIVIPKSVTFIGNSAFFECSALSSVTFEENACQNAISYDAFDGVGTLESPATLTLPDDWDNENLPIDNKTPWHGGYFNSNRYQIPIVQETVKYIDADGQEKTVDAIVVTDADTLVIWTQGWYVVTGTDVTLSQGAICQGPVNLILADGAKLTATGIIDFTNTDINTPGIEVSSSVREFVIYGQAEQTGQLIANGGYNCAGIGGKERDCCGAFYINGGTITANGGPYAAGIGGGCMGCAPYLIIRRGTITATGGDLASGIGNGQYGSGSVIGVSTTLQVKADKKNPPETVIINDGSNLAYSLAGKRYVTITEDPLPAIKAAANAVISAAVEGVTNEDIISIATAAKQNIDAALLENDVNSIKEKALTDIEFALKIFNAGQTAVIGTLGEKQDGPAIEVIDQDGNVLKLYNPKQVNYIKVKVEE